MTASAVIAAFRADLFGASRQSIVDRPLQSHAPALAKVANGLDFLGGPSGSLPLTTIPDAARAILEPRFPPSCSITPPSRS